MSTQDAAGDIVFSVDTSYNSTDIDQSVVWTTDGSNWIGDIVTPNTAPPGGTTFTPSDTAISSGEGVWQFSEHSDKPNKEPMKFRELDKDERNRLSHIMSSDAVYVRITKPDLESGAAPSYDAYIEVSNTEDFLVHVRLAEGDADTLGDVMDIQNMADSICMMLTYSGTEVFVDGEVFQPERKR